MTSLIGETGAAGRLYTAHERPPDRKGSELERTESFRIAEAIFIRSVTVAVKGFANHTTDSALDPRPTS